MPVKKDKLTTKQEIGGPAMNQIFDVAKPGTLQPADATTRPVIVTNRTIMHDPMMVKPVTTKPDIPQPGPSDPAVTPADLPVVRGTKLVINPFYAQSQSDTSEPKNPNSGIIPVDTDADGIVDGPETPADTPLPETVDSVSEPVPNIPKSSYDDDTPVANDPEATKQDKEAAELEASAKAQDEIDTLVSDKTYFLPINAVNMRRSKHVAIFGTLLIVLLALILANIAMDAGFIDIPGVNPVTHLFSK